MYIVSPDNRAWAFKRLRSSPVAGGKEDEVESRHTPLIGLVLVKLDSAMFGRWRRGFRGTFRSAAQLFHNGVLRTVYLPQVLLNVLAAD